MNFTEHRFSSFSSCKKYEMQIFIKKARMITVTLSFPLFFSACNLQFPAVLRQIDFVVVLVPFVLALLVCYHAMDTDSSLHLSLVIQQHQAKNEMNVPEI